jgi:invasion protein IalB
MSHKEVVVGTALRAVTVAFAIALPGYASGEPLQLLAQAAPAPQPKAEAPSRARRAPPPVQGQQAQTQQPVQPPQPQAAAPAARSPQRTEIVKFDNWTVTCLEYPEGTPKKTCAAQLQVQQSGSNQVLLAWTVSLNDSKQFVTMLQTPTGVSIPSGVELQPEKAGKRKLPYESCEPARCTSTFTIDAALLRELSTAPTAQVVIFAANGQSVQFNIPIKGFDKASAHLRSAL